MLISSLKLSYGHASEDQTRQEDTKLQRHTSLRFSLIHKDYHLAKTCAAQKNLQLCIQPTPPNEHSICIYRRHELLQCAARAKYGRWLFFLFFFFSLEWNLILGQYRSSFASPAPTAHMPTPAQTGVIAALVARRLQRRFARVDWVCSRSAL